MVWFSNISFTLFYNTHLYKQYIMILFKRKKVYNLTVFLCRTYMHCLRNRHDCIGDFFKKLILADFVASFCLHLGFSFRHPNCSETPWELRKYMFTLSDISIIYFYFGDILNERTQARGRTCFSDVIILLKYVQV